MTNKHQSSHQQFFDGSQSHEDEAADQVIANTPLMTSVNCHAVQEDSMSLCLPLPRETAKKISMLDELVLDGSKTPFKIVAVPGQRHPDKTTLSVYLPRTLMQRLRRLAADRGETVTTVIEAMVTAQTRSVVLTPEDYDQIANETRAAQGKGATKRQ